MEIDVMTSMHELDLRKYELSPAEWGIAEELRACSATKRGHGSNEFRLPYKEIKTFPQFYHANLACVETVGGPWR